LGGFGGFDSLDGTQYKPNFQKLNIWVITVLVVYIACIYSISRETAWTKKCDEEDEEE